MDLSPILAAVLIALPILVSIGAAIYVLRHFDNEEDAPDTDSSEQTYSYFWGEYQPTEQEEARREEEWHREQSRRQEESRRQAEEQKRREEYARRQEEHFKAEREQRGTEEGRIRNSKNEDSYYANILGLRGRATNAEIKSSYRGLIAQYHPDKVQHLGVELQELASRKTKEIVLAYEYFKKKYNL